MTERIKKKESKVWAFLLAMVIFVVMVWLISNTNGLLAQELSEKKKMMAMTQYTLEYRFDKTLKVGDWVKYQIVREGEEPQEMELKVTKKEGSGVWIVEKVAGNEFHLLVDLNEMELLKAYNLNEKGERESATPLGDKELAEAVEMMKKEMGKEEAYSQFVSWQKAEETEKVDVPAGSFTCVYLKPEYSGQYAEQMENYVEIMKQQGKSDVEIDAEISKNEPRLYFSKDVPRLLPIQIAIGWIPWIDSFEEVEGGLIKSTHMSLELKAYSGQK